MGPASRTSLVSSALLATAAGLPVVAASTGADPTVPTVFGGAVFLCTAVGNYIVLERRETFVRERERFFLEQACGPVLDDLRRVDPTARLNIMRITGLLRWRRFAFHYQHGFGNHDSDGQITLRANQGVAGLARKHGTWAVGDFKERKVQLGNDALLTDPWANMTTAQQQQCAKLTLVMSYPIFQLGRAASVGNVAPIGRCIGVVNLDSQRDDAATFYGPLLDPLLDAHKGTLAAIARVAAYILS